jgi:hypothetical protein
LNSLLDVFFLLCTHTCMNIFQFCATDVIYILQNNRRGQSYLLYNSTRMDLYVQYVRNILKSVCNLTLLSIKNSLTLIMEDISLHLKLLNETLA